MPLQYPILRPIQRHEGMLLADPPIIVPVEPQLSKPRLDRLKGHRLATVGEVVHELMQVDGKKKGVGHGGSLPLQVRRGDSRESSDRIRTSQAWGRAMEERRKQRLANDLDKLIREYGRKARRGYDPNDRTIDRKLLERIGRMKPEELDALMRDEEDEPAGDEPSTQS
jgi:hypothetical protein